MKDHVYWVNSASVVRRHEIFPFTYVDLPLPSPQDALPTISLIVPVSGEQDGRPFRFDCIEALDYPRTHLSVFIISDGMADDALAPIEQSVRRLSAEGIKIEIVKHASYRGQIAVLDEAIDADRSDIVVLSDLMSPLPPQALRKVAKIHLEGMEPSRTGPRPR